MKDAEVAAFAEELHEELCIDAPEHIDLPLICAHFGLVRQFCPFGDEEGRLVRHGRRHGVAQIAERARGTYKENFTLAHELFHWLRHPELDDSGRCTGIGHRRAGSPRHEQEANLFASTFTLPRRLFEPLCDRARPSLADVGVLSDRFRVSLSSTGLRYVRFATAACAIACTREGRVAWSKPSASFAARVRRGHAVGGAAFARLVFAGERAPDTLLPVDARAWGIDEAGVELFEHTRPIHGSSAALSLLWHP
jgi:hypothetical protein